MPSLRVLLSSSHARPNDMPCSCPGIFMRSIVLWWEPRLSVISWLPE